MGIRNNDGNLEFHSNIMSGYLAISASRGIVACASNREEAKGRAAARGFLDIVVISAGRCQADESRDHNPDLPKEGNPSRSRPDGYDLAQTLGSPHDR